MKPTVTLIKELRRMGDKSDRNNYDIGHYWNAVEEAADAIERVLTERDLAREMLLTDQTHASCEVFQKKQQRKLDEAIREADRWKAQADMSDPIEPLCAHHLDSGRQVSAKDCARLQKERAEFQKLLTERDEAIREVEKWRADAISMEIRNLNQELEAEKRRTAAFREVAMKTGHVCHSAACRPVCEMAETVDAEAQKLLADSGGEKK